MKNTIRMELFRMENWTNVPFEQSSHFASIPLWIKSWCDASLLGFLPQFLILILHWAPQKLTREDWKAQNQLEKFRVCRHRTSFSVYWSNSRKPAWLGKVLLGTLRAKKGAYKLWKQGQGQLVYSRCITSRNSKLPFSELIMLHYTVLKNFPK